MATKSVPASESAGVSRGRPSAGSGASTTEDRHLPRCPSYPHYHIPKWSVYQKSDAGRWIRVETNCLTNPATAMLSLAEFGMLIRIWLLTAKNNEWPPSDTQDLRLCTRSGRGGNLLRTLKRLESRGMLTRKCPLERESRENRIERVEQTPLPPTEKSVRAKPKIVAYPPEFQTCWLAYPSTGRQRSNKKTALKVWSDLGLASEPVMEWIVALTPGYEWTREAGRFVPMFETWLKKPDFTDPPPVDNREIATKLLGEKGVRNAENIQTWIEMKQKKDKQTAENKGFDLLGDGK